MYNYDKDYVDVCKKLSFSDSEMIELYPIIEEILTHERWQDMVSYKHHLQSRAIHSLEVCCVAWQYTRKFKLGNARDVAIGALLHDFFLYDWQTEKIKFNSLDIDRKTYVPRLHGFFHPFVAFNNSCHYFPHLINRRIEDIIIKHMWPLTVKPPRYIESWIVCLVDKSCSFSVFKQPKELPFYLGFKKKVKK